MVFRKAFRCSGNFGDGMPSEVLLSLGSPVRANQLTFRCPAARLAPHEATELSAAPGTQAYAASLARTVKLT